MQPKYVEAKFVVLTSHSDIGENHRSSTFELTIWYAQTQVRRVFQPRMKSAPTAVNGATTK